ncbi:MAG: hypothetical protein Q4Q14_00370 [Methanobrevibacter sp.]|nr:hypothetical protein [Methanobrevibacter sp.]
MKTKQDIQLELLQEIDDICSKNNLNYIIADKRALHAYLNHTFNDDNRMIPVAMTQGDIDRFCQIFENENNEDRYIEGTFNNSNYVPLYVSYGNRNTTDMDVIYRNRNLHWGIRIRIYPIIKFMDKEGNIFRPFNSRLRKEHKLRKFLSKKVENDKLGYMKTGLTVLNGAYSLTGGGSRFYKEVKKNIFIDKWEDIQQYSRVRIVNKYYDTDILKDTEKIEIDGVELSFPKNPEEFFTRAYGEDFREKTMKPKKPGNRRIIDTEIGYEKIINDTEDILREIRSTHEEIILERRKVKAETEATKNVWRLVRMTEKQIEFEDYFNDDKINELLAYDLNDEEQLGIVYKELSPAIIALKRYASFGMTFSINPKTDALIKKVLLIKESDNLVNKIEEISKKEYYAE